MMFFRLIVALRNEKGSYSTAFIDTLSFTIVALRNEKGSYSIWSILDKV